MTDEQAEISKGSLWLLRSLLIAVLLVVVWFAIDAMPWF